MDAALVAKIGADISDLRSKMGEAKGIVGNFTSSVEKVASTIGVAFGVQQVASFTTELLKLAGTADGVRQAFEKLPGAAATLNELREATRGTVSDLELMKGAVQANNFGIPLEQMGKLFQFAYERAKATGQSVDYLVNSIVVGIGRKSPLILDNLGISAVALKEKMGGISSEAATVGDVAEAVGKIATEELDKMGTSAVTAAEKIASIGAKWENIKEKMGGGLATLLAGDSPDSLLTNLNNQLTVWGSDQVSMWEKLTGSAQDYADIVKRLSLLNNTTPLGPKQPSGFVDPLAGLHGKAPIAKVRPKSGPAADKIDSTVNVNSEYNPSDTSPADWEMDLIRENYRERMEVDAEYTKTAEDNAKKRQDALQAEIQKWEYYGSVIGNQLGQAISGQESFADAIRNATLSIVEDMAARAASGAIANAFLNAPIWVAPALAAGAVGVIHSLFAGLRGSSGGGGSRGGGASGNQQGGGQIVFVLRGQDLYGSINNYNQSNAYTRPAIISG